MNDESGPKAAPEVPQPGLIVRGSKDFATQLAQCSGPDDPLFRAASLLADAWGPALNRSYRLGYENGYTAGHWQAENEMAGQWHRVAESVRAVLRQPTRVELTARRGEVA